MIHSQNTPTPTRTPRLPTSATPHSCSYLLYNKHTRLYTAYPHSHKHTSLSHAYPLSHKHTHSHEQTHTLISMGHTLTPQTHTLTSLPTLSQACPPDVLWEGMNVACMCARASAWWGTVDRIEEAETNRAKRALLAS